MDSLYQLHFLCIMKNYEAIKRKIYIIDIEEKQSHLPNNLHGIVKFLTHEYCVWTKS